MNLSRPVRRMSCESPRMGGGDMVPMMHEECGRGAHAGARSTPRRSGGGGVSRRQFLTALAAAGAGALLPGGFLRAQMTSPGNGGAAPRIIDVHHHMMPPVLLEAWQNAQGGEPLIPGLRDWTPARTLDQLDRSGVSAAILSLSSRFPALRLDAAGTLRMTRQCNEYAAEVRRDHPGRFGVFAFLPMPDVDGSLREIEYALDVLKADGIVLMTSYGTTWPGDPMYRPVFEELNRRHAVVYFHPLSPACCGSLMPSVPSSLIEYPHDTSRAVLSLLFGGAFMRYRDIKWIFSHAGGTIPMLAGRIRTLSRSTVKTLDQVAPNGIDYEFRRLHYETANSAYPPTISALLSYVPLSQVMFGTDYPYLTVGQNVQDFGRLGLSAPQRQAIHSGNALRLLPRLAA